MFSDAMEPGVSTKTEYGITPAKVSYRNGWSPTLFTDVIGHIHEDFERPPQFPIELRPAL